jgi:ech hydrogenase subunit A
VFPVVAAAVLLLVRNDRARSVVVIGSAVIIMLASVWLAAGHLFSDSWYAPLEGEWITILTLAIDVACCAYVIVKGIKHKKPLAVFLAAIQTVVIVVFELLIAHEVPIENDLYIDGFSVIMALIIGIIGSGICIYALGYMRDFQAHEDTHGQPDRRPVFFALMFVFLSAMFAIVFSNNLAWLLCAWEVTTVCSFALIGYTRTQEAVDNSFRQIIMNLIGGLAFAIALVCLGSYGILELDVLIASGSTGLMVFPIMLLAVAAFTKAAQVPFQSWLLGAMVAPTPTSALLHSSTMVKAGVFLLIKLSPCFGWNYNGMMVVLVGGLTFLFCSFIAISQSNAKRVLAYSTVANLGLIVACAGVGTPEAVWAAIFLLIFHAAAKSLLFLCVGTAEHHIGSRDIEDMDNLFVRMPMLARLMALGMLCMFIAPFGMLISKWATIVSLVDTNNVVLLFILAFGSAATFMFWAKWLGKVLATAQQSPDVEKAVHPSEWFSLVLMAALVVLLSVGFPFISEGVVVPYLVRFEADVFPGLLPQWAAITSTIDFDNLLIMAVIVLALIAAFAIQFTRPKKPTASIYLAGVALDSQERTYRNSFSGETQATQRNWYLDGWFGEKALEPTANIMSIVVIAFGFIAALMMGGAL